MNKINDFDQQVLALALLKDYTGQDKGFLLTLDEFYDKLGFRYGGSELFLPLDENGDLRPNYGVKIVRYLGAGKQSDIVIGSVDFDTDGPTFSFQREGITLTYNILNQYKYTGNRFTNGFPCMLLEENYWGEELLYKMYGDLVIGETGDHA